MFVVTITFTKCFNLHCISIQKLTSQEKHHIFTSSITPNGHLTSEELNPGEVGGYHLIYVCIIHALNGTVMRILQLLALHIYCGN